jgi:hypothetical protein
MTRKDARDIYSKASGTLSEVTRKLCLTGVAIVWIFKVGDSSSHIEFRREFLWPLVSFILALGFDLLQYTYKSAAWGIFHRLKERAKVDNFEAPDAINWLTLIFFWGKVFLTVVGYGTLLYIIGKQLFTR